jgi:transposase
MKAYSVDLRSKIVEAYQNHEGSQRQLATRFKVSPRFVQKLLHQYQHSGRIAPLARAKGFPPKLAAYESEVRETVAENADDTLEELTEKLAQRLGFKISPSTLHYHLKRLKLTRKKKHSLPSKQPQTACKNYG